MANAFTHIAFTPSVRLAQERNGIAFAGDPSSDGEPANTLLGEEEEAFISRQRSFYLSTVSQTGWPYVQHRGGPPGFLKVLDRSHLAFADYAGNRQLISVGNLSVNDRVALILVDYTNRLRLKILGHMAVQDLAAGRDESKGIVDAGYKARPQRVMKIRVEAYDWNCPQHIPLRFEAEDVQRELSKRDARIADLERRLATMGRADR